MLRGSLRRLGFCKRLVCAPFMRMDGFMSWYEMIVVMSFSSFFVFSCFRLFPSFSFFSRLVKKYDEGTT